MPVGLRGPAIKTNHWQAGVAEFAQLRFGLFGHPLPAAMREGRDKDRPVLGNGGLHVGDRLGVHAVVHAQGLLRCVVGKAVARRVGLFRLVGPVRLKANPIVEPALESAPAAGAIVVFALVFIVPPRQRVEHARADQIDLVRQLAVLQRCVLEPAQVIDDACQAKAGAGAFLALVQNHAGSGVGAQKVAHFGLRWVGIGQTQGLRLKLAVAQVGRVLACARGAHRQAVCGFSAGCHHRRNTTGSAPLATSRLGWRAAGCGPERVSADKHILEHGQAVRAAVDQPARSAQVARSHRSAKPAGLVQQKLRQHHSGHFGRVGNVGC